MTRWLVALSFIFSLVVVRSSAQLAPVFYRDGVAFYIIAHQDDWQLFMGSDVYKDINRFETKTPDSNNRKVVFIYTTAGNVHDDDDKKTCNCKDPSFGRFDHIPYWSVREAGARNSVHLAGCRYGSVGPGIPYAAYTKASINGHPIATYVFKNTKSYFMRIKCGEYSYFPTYPYDPVHTVDSSTAYLDWNDFVNTIYGIVEAESKGFKPEKTYFHFPEINSHINPNDHVAHYTTGKAAFEMVRKLGRDKGACYEQSLYQEYNIANLPENLSPREIQVKTAISSAYCLALLDRNAWAEWSDVYMDWSRRNYCRKVSSCDSIAVSDTPITGKGGYTIKLFPNPSDKILNIILSEPVTGDLTLRVCDPTGAMFHEETVRLTSATNVELNTTDYAFGEYFLTIFSSNGILGRAFFMVNH